MTAPTGPAWLEGPPLEQAAGELVAGAGLGRVDSLSPLAGGGNNRTYRLAAGGRDILLKAYFRDPADPRDRLKAEFDFSRFAWDRGIRVIPEPLARDARNALGLYAFIHGRMLEPHEVTPARVDESLDFCIALNRGRHAPAVAALAAGLADGSEAYFSLTDHLAGVARRVARLGEIEGAGPINHEARAFVRGELGPAWERVTADVRAAIPDLGGDAPLPSEQRCLSPSDFGFHNAMLAGDGKLIFHDFEYAGWDDPGKTAGDFFCQPRLPVPPGLFEHFVGALVDSLGLPASHVRRARLLRGVYQVKWCCIMMNEFLPLGARRRRFALSEADAEARKVRQLAQARRGLGALTIEGNR
ncbi:MAG: phosphotransferase [Planctomycetota bacterium]|nr:phosphotransferase [Planctomycetota bacterium]